MRKMVRAIQFAIGLAIPVVAFNNCSQPHVEKKSDISALAEKAQHAYDAHFDQLAYMSCSEMPSKTFDSSAYFTFRAGAYRTGGLKIRDGYLASIEQDFRLPEDQVDLISTSPINSNSFLQMSIRSRANFQAVFSQSGSPEANEDFANFFTELGKPELVETLYGLLPGARARYMRNGYPTGNRFEGSLHFGDSTALADSVRTMLSSEGMLALTYSDAQISPSYARGPADLAGGDASNSAFGKGLILSFRQPTSPSGAVYGQYPNYALREITELNLENRTDTSNIRPWSCPVSMQFRIVRPGDDPVVPCQAGPDPAVMSAELAIVRRSLRVEDWYVDMANRCITPKKQMGRNCYGTIQTVQYNLANACTPGTNTQDCVHWASICVRQ
ncbi:MAG: hypothetical protein NDI61_00110 [Bdellovibrionaceae bacterium]|nr:hypothetical protein [Pseudobdellovibrionaceae bacterium]